MIHNLALKKRNNKSKQKENNGSLHFNTFHSTVSRINFYLHIEIFERIVSRRIGQATLLQATIDIKKIIIIMQRATGKHDGCVLVFVCCARTHSPVFVSIHCHPAPAPTRLETEWIKGGKCAAIVNSFFFPTPNAETKKPKPMVQSECRCVWRWQQLYCGS